MKKNTLRNTAVDLLLRIDKDSGYSHLLINNEMKKRKISIKDQGLLTEIIYGTIERKITLDYYLEPFIKSKKKIDPWVKIVLRISMYQMIYLDRVPDHAIINEAVEIAKQRGHKGIASFINGVLRSVQRHGVRSTATITNNVKRLSIETSTPTWLVKRWIDHYGYSVTKDMCEENLTRQPISIRVQPLKISRDKAMEELIQLGFKVRESEFSKQGIIIDEGNILQTELFSEGYVTIQDQSSMLAAEMLQVKPDMNVLDACSAPGGKATHIAEKMNNQGVLDAYDLHEKKVNLIKEKAKSLDLTIINPEQNDARKLSEFHEHNHYDRIIVDAPCSGLGVIKSKPDVKYNKQPDDINRLAKIQLNILNSVAPLLKKEGLLIYSTCTVDKSENEDVIKLFLQNHTNYSIDPAFFNELPEPLRKADGIGKYGLQLFPQNFQTDGFFLTRLIRKY